MNNNIYIENESTQDSFGYYPLSEYPDMLCVDDLANIFRVSAQTIRKEMKSGKFGEIFFMGRLSLIPKNQVINKFFNFN